MARVLGLYGVMRLSQNSTSDPSGKRSVVVQPTVRCGNNHDTTD